MAVSLTSGLAMSSRGVNLGGRTAPVSMQMPAVPLEGQESDMATELAKLREENTAVREELEEQQEKSARRIRILTPLFGVSTVLGALITAPSDVWPPLESAREAYAEISRLNYVDARAEASMARYFP